MVEVKFKDITFDNTGIETGGAASNLLLIAQGDGESERNGRKILVTDVHWRWQLSLPDNDPAQLAEDVVRLMLVIDKQCNGAGLSTTALLTEENYQAFTNLHNQDRFDILFDETVPLKFGNAGTVVTGKLDGEFAETLRLPVLYKASTPAVADQTSINLVALALSQNGVADIASRIRVRFLG